MPVARSKPKQEYRCTCCGAYFTSREKNFYGSKVEMYRFNDGRLTVCMSCVIAIYDDLKIKYKDPAYAMYHLCAKMGWYFHEEIFKSISSAISSVIIGEYVKSISIGYGKGKTFDNNLTDYYYGEISSTPKNEAELERKLDLRGREFDLKELEAKIKQKEQDIKQRELKLDLEKSRIKNKELEVKQRERELSNIVIPDVVDIEDGRVYNQNWIGDYSDEDLNYLNEYYRKLMQDYKIETENHRDYARKISRASLYMDKMFNLMMNGNDKNAESAYNKARDAFDKLCQSAKFAENSRSAKEQKSMALSGYGATAAQIESGTYIYKHIPLEKDDVDLMLEMFATINKSL